MHVIFALLFLISIVMVVVSLLKPQWSLLPFKKKSRLKAVLSWIIISLVCASIGGAFLPEEEISREQEENTVEEKIVESTSEMTTQVSTTEAPTTEAPTTEVPTTEVPTTAAVIESYLSKEDDCVMNDIVLDHGMAVQVFGAEVSGGDMLSQPGNNMEYIILYVGLSNWSTDTKSFSYYDFKMSDSRGVKQDPAFTTIDGDMSLESGELLPNGYVEGTIVFERPIGDNYLVLYYESDWLDDEVEIDLSRYRQEFIYLRDYIR